MKRLLSLLLVLSLILALPLSAFAAEAPTFTDIDGHWAAAYINEVSQAGWMNGTGGTAFSPNKGMTRGMFVTVLGRFAKINPDAWKMNYDGTLFSDVSSTSYYAPYINWAARTGIALGSGHGTFMPDALITREQMLTMLSRYGDAAGKVFLPQENISPFTFSDQANIASWAKDAVSELQLSGIIQGMNNADGTVRFAPKSNATRAQAAAIFSRMQLAIADDPHWSEVFPTLIMLSETTLTLPRNESFTLTAQLFPANVTNTTVTWLSSNPAVATVAGGKVSWVSPGYATIYAISSNGCKAECDLTCSKKAAESNPATKASEEPASFDLAFEGESYDEKCERIFGLSVSDPRTVYSCDEEAQYDIVSIEVPAWDIDENGEKFTHFITLEVHENIASTVEQIFAEIYACPAQYPIYTAGGYRYESWSEHNCGLAIDINPNENYYCSPDGQAIVGSFFSPEDSEYSIPVDGEIDRIFQSYGFTRGINWRSGYKDYMHYSFFGT